MSLQKSLILRLLSPVSVVLSWINSKPLTFSFYMILSDILNISVPPLILLFLFKLLWDCKIWMHVLQLSPYSLRIALYVLQNRLLSGFRRSWLQLLLDRQNSWDCLFSNQLYIWSVIFFIINYSGCWQITSVLSFSPGAWDSGLLNSNMKTVLLESNKNFMHHSVMPTLSQSCVMVWLVISYIRSSCNQV